MPQRCLYEVLGIERTADDAEIKKAYRKQALVWHPGEAIEQSNVVCHFLLQQGQLFCGLYWSVGPQPARARLAAAAAAAVCACIGSSLNHTHDPLHLG